MRARIRITMPMPCRDATSAIEPSESPQGYRDAGYAEALCGVGAPRWLPHARGWILERQIGATGRRDAMGPYPIFSCSNPAALADDLVVLAREGLVSLVLVTDPMADFGSLTGSRLFDVARPFKTHYLADLEHGPEKIASRHHAYYARRAARMLDIDRVARPLERLDEWLALYATLVERHGLDNLRRFSRQYFARLLALPGVLMYCCTLRGVTAGMQILILQDDVAHAHLAAFSEDGYAAGASYLLDWHALQDLQCRVRYINWGGGTALSDGLARYKRGWSNLERTSWLLGSVFDREAYHRFATPAGDGSYFPAYRYGEFAATCPED